MLTRVIYALFSAFRFAFLVGLLGLLVVYAGAPAFLGFVFVSAGAIAAVWMWSAIGFLVVGLFNFATFNFFKKMQSEDL